MPEHVDLKHPLVRGLFELGPEGLEVRRGTGQDLYSVCLIHGPARAVVSWPRIGIWGGREGVVVPLVHVACYPWCGWRLEWRGEATGGRG